MPKVQDFQKRLFSKILVKPSDCWEWQASLNRFGYGQFNVGGPVRANRTRLAHRVMYEYMVGKIGEDMELDHICHNRKCVNPDHLVQSARSENASRAIRPRKTHCKNGHEFTADNTSFDKEGCQVCKTCRRQNKERYKEKCRTLLA